MNFHKKIVALITLFFTGTSGVFLITGAGLPGLRLLAALVFFICALNLSVYWREFGRWLNKTAHTARAHLAEARTAKEPEEEEQPKAQTLPPKTREMKKAKPEKVKTKVRSHYEEEPDGDFENDFDDDDFDLDEDDDFEFEDDER